jgi:hypothetical protein
MPGFVAFYRGATQFDAPMRLCMDLLPLTRTFTPSVQSCEVCGDPKGHLTFIVEKKLMHKHLQNLERLCQKLQFRYGQDDELVMQVKHEIESNVTKYSKSNRSENQGQLRERNEEFSAPMY